VTRIAAGMSGAAVYRVDADGRAFVLKIASEQEDPDEWRRTLAIQRVAAAAGLAPRIVHVDDDRRAVLTDLVVDRSFIGWYRDPATHDAALAQLGRTIRRLHGLPIPPGSSPRDPHGFLRDVAARVREGFSLPGFASQAIDRALATAPAQDRPLVLGHNDANPTNVIWNGEAILLLDWATAGPVDPLYDLAVLAVFLRMDERTTARLYAAYAAEADAPLPARFASVRRLAAALPGAVALDLARKLGHPRATGTEPPDATPTLAEVYQRLRQGTLKLSSPDGLWAFGLALLKESLAA
jgi:aminoglycoside phosphotransferase (APT) family kinase protein